MNCDVTLIQIHVAEMFKVNCPDTISELNFQLWIKSPRMTWNVIPVDTLGYQLDVQNILGYQLSLCVAGAIGYLPACSYGSDPVNAASETSPLSKLTLEICPSGLAPLTACQVGWHWHHGPQTTGARNNMKHPSQIHLNSLAPVRFV